MTKTKTKPKKVEQNSFFEETTEEANNKTYISSNSNAPKNTLYVFKNGETCRVVYDAKDKNFIQVNYT
jgi:hypothetical protein